MLKMVTLECPKCGASLNADDREVFFCGHCGAKIMPKGILKSMGRGKPNKISYQATFKAEMPIKSAVPQCRFCAIRVYPIDICKIYVI